MGYEVIKGRFDFFNLKNTFLVYLLIQLPISGLITLLSGQPSEIGLDPQAYPGQYQYALWVSLIGVLFFQFGYYTRPPRSISLPKLLCRSWNGSRVLVLLMVYMALGYFSFLVMVRSYGGLSVFLDQREQFRAGGLSGMGFLIFPATSLMSLAALAFTLKGMNASVSAMRAVSIALIYLLAIIPSYYMGFRSAIALPLLQAVVAWNYGFSKISPRGVCLTAVLFMGGFTVYGISRAIPPGLNIDINTYIEIGLEKPDLVFAVVQRSKGTEVLSSVINRLDHTGDYEFGWRSVLETLTIMVPRSLWPNKPMPQSEHFTTYFFGDDLAFSRGSDRDVWGGISPTAIGEWYWNFGLFGVAFGLFILGRVARAAYSTLAQNPDNKSILLLYASFFSYFTMFAEAQQGYINSLAMYGVMVLLTFNFITYRSVRANE